ncbi:MAG: hypothetical protein LBT42_04390 [Tannerella sp.]|jgi:hypothetical protein|nr:hypothetical protein [Tannerella sp.]
MIFKHFIIALLIVLPTVSKAQTPDEIFSWLPEVDGWKKPASKEVFNPDNLFDRINGAAPLFIENGFMEMTAFDYVKGEDYITVQVYRHASPEDAFGMYSTERSPELTFYKIGGEAHGDNGSLFLFADKLYFKIRSNVSTESSGNAIRRIAGSLASKAAPAAAYPAMLKSFPEDGKIPYSEMYITANYIGHDFLNRVFVCKYMKESLVYQLFIIDAGSSDAAKEILKKYVAFAKQEIDLKEGSLLIKDRYNGDIPVLWKGGKIVGIFNEDGKTVPDADKILSYF